MKNIVLIMLATMIMSNISHAIFYDNFEDGDWSKEPVWFKTNPRAADPLIMSDPVRSNNLVIRQIWDGIASTLETPQSWEGFDLSGEYFAESTSSGKGFQLMTPEYHFLNIEINSNDTHNYLRVIDGDRNLEYQTILNSTLNNTWWRFHAWHDIETNLIHASIQNLDGDLIGEISFVSHENVSLLPCIESVVLYGNGQYYDNIILIPEPATLSLLFLGGISFIRKYRRK